MGHYNPETEDEIRECTDTIKNYFTYLLYHNVCPEYNDDLEEARKTCDRAATELWMTQQLVHHDGPGSFNRGCSMLFGGHYFDSVSDLAIWKTVLHADEHIFTIDAARKVVKYAIAITGNDLTAHKFKVLADQDGITAKEIEDIDGFEVISVEEPSADILAYYKELSPDLIPVGKIVAKEFRDPARGLIDLTPAEKIAWDAGLAPTYKFEFLMETTLLPHILPGMKFITTVFETNFGQYFFDETLAVLPTFYTFLYNDWMMDYKAPVPLDFIPDEEEIARRRAKESIMRPVEPTPAEWAMHIMVNQLDLRPLPGEDPLVTAWQIFNCLESFGWDLQELKELIGLVKPQEGKDESTKEDLSTQEDLSSQESQSAKVDKGKQAVRDEQNIEQPIVPTREVCLDVFYEPDPAHRIPPPEVFEAYCKRNLQKLAEKGVFPKQYAEGTEKESLDRVIKSFHTPERIKVTLSPEYKKAFREYRLKRELKSIETQQEHLKDLEFPAQELRQEVVPGSGSQDTLIDEQAIPQIPKVDG